MDRYHVILAALLGHHSATKKNIPQVLEAYDHVRRPFANYTIEGSKYAGALYELRSDHGDDYATLAPAIQDQFMWVESEGILAQIDRALKWMSNRERANVKASL